MLEVLAPTSIDRKCYSFYKLALPIVKFVPRPLGYEWARGAAKFVKAFTQQYLCTSLSSTWELCQTPSRGIRSKNATFRLQQRADIICWWLNDCETVEPKLFSQTTFITDDGCCCTLIIGTPFGVVKLFTPVENIGNTSLARPDCVGGTFCYTTQECARHVQLQTVHTELQGMRIAKCLSAIESHDYVKWAGSVPVGLSDMRQVFVEFVHRNRMCGMFGVRNVIYTVSWRYLNIPGNTEIT